MSAEVTPQCPLPSLPSKPQKPGSKRIKLPDGGGLYMLLTPTGRRSWFLTYRHGGRSKTLPLGAFPAVSLTAARLARERAKLALAEGRDPGAPDAAPVVATSTAPTLREAAEEWLKVAGSGWKRSHRERVESRLRMNVFPPLGNKRLDDIQAPDVLAAVRLVEARGAMDISRRTVQAVAAIIPLQHRERLGEAQPRRRPSGRAREAAAS